MQEYKIRQDEQNIRLDKIIASIDNSISRTSVQRLIEEGKILVNEKQEKPSYKVNEGDIINISSAASDVYKRQAIMAKCKDSLSGIGGKIRPGVVHRIDKDTSRTNNNCQE